MQANVIKRPKCIFACTKSFLKFGSIDVYVKVLSIPKKQTKLIKGTTKTTVWKTLHFLLTKLF